MQGYFMNREATCMFSGDWVTGDLGYTPMVNFL
jgi:hypothetical protein